MKNLIIPPKLNESDTVAFISISGGRAYYGPTVLTPFAQPGKLDEYTETAIRRTLFSNEVIGEIKPAEKNTPIDRTTTYTVKEGSKEVQYERFLDNDEIDDPKDIIPWTPGTGYKVLQGSEGSEAMLSRFAEALFGK